MPRTLIPSATPNAIVQPDEKKPPRSQRTLRNVFSAISAFSAVFSDRDPWVACTAC
jgi:hypothetical protein